MMIDMDTVLIPNINCPVREVGSGLVIMAAAGTATHSLDEIGAFIWRQFDGQRTLGQVVEALVAEYDVARPQAADDVQAFLAQLIQADLIQSA